MADEILTLKEVAEYLKVGERTVYRLVQDGRLPGFKVGGTWRFRRDHLDQWIEKHTTTAPDARDHADTGDTGRG